MQKNLKYVGILIITLLIIGTGCDIITKTNDLKSQDGTITDTNLKKNINTYREDSELPALDKTPYPDMITSKGVSLPADTIFYIVNIVDSDESIAFNYNKLAQLEKAIVTRENDTQVIASIKDGEISVIFANDRSGDVLIGKLITWNDLTNILKTKDIVWSPL